MFQQVYLEVEEGDGARDGKELAAEGKNITDIV